VKKTWTFDERPKPPAGLMTSAFVDPYRGMGFHTNNELEIVNFEESKVSHLFFSLQD
jgi:hypothetical protein